MRILTNRNAAIAKHVKKLGKSKSYRDEHGEFLCVGDKLFVEALSNDVEIVAIITSKELKHKVADNVRCYSAHDSIIDSLSPMQNSQGLIFTCKFPKMNIVEFGSGTHILLDCIQDPGNLGTIIRSALAFGIGTVLLTDGCADLYNPKTVRATMGAMFKQRVVHVTPGEISDLKLSGLKFIGASNSCDSIDIGNASLTNSVVVLGSEGQGISDYLLEICDELIRIPISPNAESLNVSTAASIIMWEANKY